MTSQSGNKLSSETATSSSSPRRSTQQEAPSTQRGRRTRGALVAAARELFEERGFRETRISDIAERSGTSYGTFYHYFETKEAVLHELFTTVAGEMFSASQMHRDVPDDPIARIEAANRQYFAAAGRNAWLIAVIDEMAIRDSNFRELKLQLRDLFLRRNETGIRRLQESGAIDPQLDAKIAASALGGMIEHFTQMWFIHGVAFDEEAAISTLTQLWAQAIGLPLTSRTNA
ncbi:MAG: TetR/AcrR family transcriptional regulator [Rhodococcus sp. (in: high G+C Gram-positive bacteria)]|nr:MAG: TetR/AcrR family transcriptional regulator [Rhodococcus sp. (in: high G+C Gram-positive bacteria)]